MCGWMDGGMTVSKKECSKSLWFVVRRLCTDSGIFCTYVMIMNSDEILNNVCAATVLVKCRLINTILPAAFTSTVPKHTVTTDMIVMVIC